MPARVRRAHVPALAAPRPLLFSNSDKDNIFPLTGVYHTHAGLKRIYQLYNASDKLGLLITEGPHLDTQELQVPAFRWFNKWLKGKSDPITRVADKPIDVKQLRVFATLPTDEKNTTIHETFTPMATAGQAPASMGEWVPRREGLQATLKEKSFRHWPKEGDPLDVKVLAEKEAEGLKLQVLEFASEENLRFPVYVVRGAKHAKLDRAMESTDQPMPAAAAPVPKRQRRMTFCPAAAAGIMTAVVI